MLPCLPGRGVTRGAHQAALPSCPHRLFLPQTYLQYNYRRDVAPYNVNKAITDQAGFANGRPRPGIFADLTATDPSGNGVTLTHDTAPAAAPSGDVDRGNSTSHSDSSAASSAHPPSAAPASGPEAAVDPSGDPSTSTDARNAGPSQHPRRRGRRRSTSGQSKASNPAAAIPEAGSTGASTSGSDGGGGGCVSEEGSPRRRSHSPPPPPTSQQQQQQQQQQHKSRLRTVARLLPRVLFLHTGGTLGMDPEEAFEEDEGHNLRVRAGATESSYKGSLRPGEMLSSLLSMVPELDRFANVDLKVLFNKDSSRVGPPDWVNIARALDHHRHNYDAFIVVHGTDTLAYTAAALSLMLCGFKKPIVLTGSQLPLRAPRTDARQNLLDSIQVATSAFSPPHVALQEVAVCFGGKLMRGNRTQKVNSAAYQAFDSPTYPYLATLGIDVDWNTRVMLQPQGAYKPRFQLDPRVIRVPVVPGSDPRVAYGDLYGRGVRGVVLEAFGVGNLPDQAAFGWLPWLRDQTAKGLQVCLISQCQLGPLQPALYRAGQLAAAMGVDAGPQMTPECAVVKLMFCLRHPDLALGVPLAGEL